MPDMSEWETFYVIVGAAAGALIGLQFVVMTLIADRLADKEAAAAFTTPTVVYFATSLLLSALVSVPWPWLSLLAVSWAIIGLAGCAYGIVVARHMRRQGVYSPAPVDWLFNLVLPSLSYLSLAVAAAAVTWQPAAVVWAPAGVSLVLLFVGVRNAWGIVSHHVLNGPVPGVGARG